MYNNISHITNFRIDVADNNGTNVFQSAVQSAIIPSITISPTEVNIMNTTNQAAGSSIQFDPLNVKILIDEDLYSYLEIFKWCISLVDYKNDNANSQFSNNVPKTVYIHILDNSKKNIVLTYRFNNAWPSVLGELVYEYTDETNTPISCMVTFMYSTFDILDKDGNLIRPFTDNSNGLGNFNPNNNSNSFVGMGLSMHPSLR